MTVFLTTAMPILITALAFLALLRLLIVSIQRADALADIEADDWAD
jgi:hypothetical protein